MNIYEYRCTRCGLEIVIAKDEKHKLPKAECQSCNTMTMRPQKKLK